MPEITPLMDHMLPVLRYLEMKDAAPAMVDRVHRLVTDLEAAEVERDALRAQLAAGQPLHQQVVDLQDLIDARRRSGADAGVTLAEVRHELSKLAPF